MAATDPQPATEASPAGPATTVSVQDVTIAYRLRRERRRAPVRTVTAVDGVSFDLHAGDVVGLVGGNGAGKSTLLRAVAGLVPVTAGQILAVDRPLLLSVGAALIGTATGRRNAYLGCLAQGMTGEQARQAAEVAIEFADLGEAIDRPLETYSSGMAARLKFAIATVHTHEILLVDEALSVGDAAFSEKARARMAELSAAAGTVVLVSHSPKSLLDSCTRGIWLEQGRLVADGDIADVLDDYRVTRRRVRK